MSGPYGPNGPGEGSNDPTQHWGGQQGAGGAGPTQHWGGAAQPPQQAQPTQHWGDPNAQQPQQQWGQPQQPAPQQQWGQPQQPQQPTGPQQQWGQTQPPPQDWNSQAANAQQQWGQQPQQQWGQQGAPQQQWGQQPPPSGGKSKGLLIGLIVAGVLVVAAVIGLLLVLLSSDELDNAAVQDGVARVLKDSYGIADVSDVSCPSGQAVEVDATFTCDLKVSGEAKQVTVKITKDDGTYEVGRPN
ncbi:DUF4333 domain-containing protein [Nocardia sp. AG03]|uniref:DUF4333 domain-containing protein n=1 Tax=Nocardia sp. AG03 TaxID=3025312 RepID=UPI002418412C|nr:DUF4333 domain-containing protein [Nocardia sp. AG03]